MAPPLLFWKVRASTTCSRVTLPILVRTRPIGRPWSWSMGGMPPAGPGEAPPPLLPPPPPPPPAVGSFAAPPTTLEVGRRPLPGFMGVTGFLPGSGEAGVGVWVSVRDICVLVYVRNVVVRTIPE